MNYLIEYPKPNVNTFIQTGDNKLNIYFIMTSDIKARLPQLNLFGLEVTSLQLVCGSLKLMEDRIM